MPGQQGLAGQQGMPRSASSGGLSVPPGVQASSQHGMRPGSGRVSPQLAALLSQQQGPGELPGLAQNAAAGKLLTQLAALIATQQEPGGLLDHGNDMTGGGLPRRAAGGMRSQYAQGDTGDCGPLDLLSDAAAALGGGRRRYSNGILPGDDDAGAAADMRGLSQQYQEWDTSLDNDLSGLGGPPLPGPHTVTSDAAAQQLHHRQVSSLPVLRSYVCLGMSRVQEFLSSDQQESNPVPLG